jgi:urease accessory protein
MRRGWWLVENVDSIRDRKMWHARIVLGLLGLISSGAALAHTGAHAVGGWTAGLAHPFMGLDHLLAMVAVGVWAVQLGGRYIVLLPAAFVAAMAAGAAAAVYGTPLPQAETMMALSVLALGALIAATVKTRSHWPVSLVALFALFHGHAHGSEMAAVSATWLYFAGFMVATSLLHTLGVVTATVLKARPQVLRIGGAAMGLMGTALLVAALA